MVDWVIIDKFQLFFQIRKGKMKISAALFIEKTDPRQIRKRNSMFCSISHGNIIADSIIMFPTHASIY